MNKFIKIIILLTLSGIVIYYTGEALVLFIGNTAYKYKQNEAAVYVYTRLLEHNPKKHIARKNLANIYFDTGAGEEGIELLNVSDDIAGDFYKIYLSASKYLTDKGEIKRAIDILNSVKGQYAQRKIRDNRAKTPSLMPKAGDYDRRVSVIPIAYIGETSYISLDGENFEKATKALTLPLGKSTVYAVSVNQKGVVSDVISANYNVELSTVFAQKELLIE